MERLIIRMGQGNGATVTEAAMKAVENAMSRADVHLQADTLTCKVTVGVPEPDVIEPAEFLNFCQGYVNMRNVDVDITLGGLAVGATGAVVATAAIEVWAPKQI